jgi:hypothetical protein
MTISKELLDELLSGVENADCTPLKMGGLPLHCLDSSFKCNG